MMLLKSNAEYLFWLGRYMTRVQYLCSQFPFMHDHEAVLYAQAFALPAFDASSLNQLVLNAEYPISFKQQFEYMKSNIHELRGVLSAYTYAELNKIIKTASENPNLICDFVSECHEVIEAEAHEVFLFIKLGQAVEQLDRQLRLNQETKNTAKELSLVLELLDKLGWEEVSQQWHGLLGEMNLNAFYRFSEHVQQMFEVDV